MTNPNRECPWALLALVVTGALLGGLVGAGVNLIDGPHPGDVNGPVTIFWLLPVSNPMPLPPPPPTWGSRIAHGLLDGLWWGAILSLLFIIGVAWITRARCPFGLVLPFLLLVGMGALIGRLLGGDSGLVVGAGLAFFSTFVLLRRLWLRSRVGFVAPLAMERTRVRPATLCLAGLLLGIVIGGSAGAVAVFLSPAEFAWREFILHEWISVTHTRLTLGGKYLSGAESLFEACCNNAAIGGALGFVLALVLALVVLFARENLLRPQRVEEDVADIPAPATGDPNTATTGILLRQEGYREIPERPGE
jgi:hypothetical protein